MKIQTMKTSKLLAVLFLAGATVFTSCSEDEDEPVKKSTKEIEVTSNITENTTWSYPNVYVLRSRISVEAGATLTIEPGVVVKGGEGQEAASKALVIARDAKLMAVGTAARPIVFTSVLDQITPSDINAGNMASPNLLTTDKGLWGGVIVCGNATISAGGDVEELQIEGIPTSDLNGLYGGTNDADNSGMISYISIRHGGTLIGAGNEINGLTLAGVGSGTQISNVEIVANLDDGIEWFGGTVNVTNAVVWGVGDDGMDTDQSWGGTMDNYYVVAPEGHCHELDGPEGTVHHRSHTFTNGTIYSFDGTTTSKDLLNVDDNSLIDAVNINFNNPQTGQLIREDDDIDLNNVAGVTFTGVTVNATDVSAHVGADPVPAGITSGSTGNANLAPFADWTWAEEAGAIE